MPFDAGFRARHSPGAWLPYLKFLCISALVACGGGDGSGTTGANGSNTTVTGSLSVTVSGLPAGSTGAVTVTGPAGFSRSLTATETLSALSPGQYDITAAEVTASANRYGAAPATQVVSVTAQTTASSTVGYSILTGSLSIGVSGLPEGLQPSVVITGPNGYSRVVATAGTIAGLVPGNYHITEEVVSSGSRTFAAEVPALDLSVTASATPIPVSVTYRLASGALAVVAEGLPTGASASAIVTGPNDFQRSVVIGDTLVNLAAGSYTIMANPVTVGVDAYRVSEPTVIVVEPSLVPIAASIRFSLSTGRLNVTFSGLPSGVNASLTLTGPNGFSRSVPTSQVISGLAPGEYVLAASSVVTSTATYSAAAPTQRVMVVPSTAPVPVGVAYVASTGGIAVSVNGLPQSVAAAVSVTGPNGFTATVATSSTLTNLQPGAYTLVAASVTAGPHGYNATPTSRIVNVEVSTTPVTAIFTYALSTGGIALNVSGLPTNVLADITLTGPGGYTRSITATTLVLGLAPGTYVATAKTAQSGTASWAPNPTTQNIAVTPSTSAVAASVNFITATGTLTVTVNGMGPGVNAKVTLTGPNSYSLPIVNTTTITGLAQGSYNIAAAIVTSGSTTYTPASASQNVNLGGGATSSAVVTYTASTPPPPPPPPPPPGLNLTIDGMHVQQAVQSYAGTVPLVAGRDGLLRVFVKASASNSAAPAVRVRFYSGATLTSTITVNAPSASVPTAITEGTLTSSWNYSIPGALLQPGVKILADVDPTNTVAESSDADNAFPVSGIAATMDVRAVSTMFMRLVPVLQSVNALQGNVTVGNANQFTSTMQQLFPLGTVDADVRAPFTTNAPVLQSGDGNGAWGQILSEINALRTADASTRYYYGVVKVSYGSGIAGLGYVPGRAAIGWDYLGSAEGVLAHEVGHNFGRFHAPACGAGGPDPSYPYAGGVIGVYGYNISTNALKAPTITDLMGYCNPVWVSDYTFTEVLNYRTSNPVVNTAAFGGNYARPGLLVWGRVQNGQLILEPTFEVVAPASLPQRGGRHRLQALGSLGETLFDFSFDGEQVADLPDPSAQHFAFVVPLDAMNGTQPTRIRLSSGNRQSELLSAAPSGAATAEPLVERSGTNTVRVTWRDAGTRGVLVRDSRSGQILAFARGGQATVFTRESALDLTTSDGVRSTRRRVSVKPGGSSPLR